MTLEDVEKEVRRKMAMAAGMKAKVKFDFGAEGLIWVDTTQSPVVVSNMDAPSEVTLACTLATFGAILEGRQDPNIAFMTGKLKIKGSMGLAMKLSGILEE
jgi:putative sterol carrier protein